MRERPHSAAIIDQILLETEPDESDPVYINFALTGRDRLVREFRSALHRRNREELAARLAIAERIQSEMRETIAVMLLSCELAMSLPDVPPLAAEKIRTIDTLARELRLPLEVNGSDSVLLVVLRYCTQPFAPITFRCSFISVNVGSQKI